MTSISSFHTSRTNTGANLTWLRNSSAWVDRLVELSVLWHQVNPRLAPPVPSVVECDNFIRYEWDGWYAHFFVAESLADCTKANFKSIWKWKVSGKYCSYCKRQAYLYLCVSNKALNYLFWFTYEYQHVNRLPWSTFSVCTRRIVDVYYTPF